MANCKYIADSALLILSSLLLRAQSDAIAPGLGRSADGMSVSPFIPSID